jgi:hypothetical protein
VLFRLSSLLLAGLLTAVALPLGVHASPNQSPPPVQSAAADLKRPAASLSSRRPRFVHQSQNNCAFASAAMLVDKWTGGQRRPDQNRMRTASRAPRSGGVGMSQLARGMQSVTGMRVLWSPSGGDPLTWNGLMARLGKGGAAVIAGSYSHFPSHYQRWGRSYAALGPTLSGHAVYIERYEPGRRGGRVWMMDPLASGSNYEGEWIPADDLKRFIWKGGQGFVHAAATPEPPPLAGIEFGSPEVIDAGLAFAGEKMSISIPLDIRPGWTAPDNLGLSVVWHPQALDPDVEVIASAYLADMAAARAEAEAALSTAASDETLDSSRTSAVPVADMSPEALGEWRSRQPRTAVAEQQSTDEQAGPADPRPLRPTKPVVVPLTGRGKTLVAQLKAPTGAGTYRLSVEVKRRDGTAFPGAKAPRLADMNVRLRGTLAAQYGSPGTSDAITQGRVASVELNVANLGSSDWREGNELELVGTWQTSTGTSQAGTTVVTLGSQKRGTFTLDVIVPTDSLAGDLVIGLVTADGVPLSEYGLAPVVLALEFERAPPTDQPTDPDDSGPQQQ